MNFKALLVVVFVGIGSIFCSGLSLASQVQIDLTGTISNTYILNVVDGNSVQEDANLWDINTALPLGSKLNFSINYNLGAPEIYSGGGLSVYGLDKLSIGGGFFQVNTAPASIGVGNDQYSGWDFISTGFMSPSETGISLNFQNEIYYLVAASFSLTDKSGTALSNSSLPSDQSQLDAFWSNNHEPSNHWDHLATFDLQFVKDPLVNSIANSTWPNGEALYVVGYFDSAKLTHVEAPEPAGLFLLVIGAIGIFARRFWRK